ncbi:hypothetical protein ACFOLD_14035 [Kocuria carniphila]|uniref:hypothetical protein n=1 Tax=Kocuria carniphila TaxID=262208 RepID=UPI00361189A5
MHELTTFARPIRHSVRIQACESKRTNKPWYAHGALRAKQADPRLNWEASAYWLRSQGGRRHRTEES